MKTDHQFALHACGSIIVLNGPSSSGKTSIGKSLQSRLAQPYQHIQLDAFREMELPDFWHGWKQEPPEAVERKVAALCRAMNAAISAYAHHGQSVIFDMVLDKASWRYLLEDLVDFPVYLVGVTCAVEELMRREKARGNRELGLAAKQAASIHADKAYDLIVDTTASTPEHSAAKVTTWLESKPELHAFKTMRAKLGIT